MAFTDIYKPSQGRYTRWGTFAGVMAIVLVGAYVLSEWLAETGLAIRYGVPTAVLAGSAVLTFWLVNRPGSADFLIATEGEMKKVSWSSRREVTGSTKVVIVTTIIVAGILFGVDLVLSNLMQAVGLMGR